MSSRQPMPYELASRGLLDSHGVAAFWDLMRSGHSPGDCRACLRWTDRNTRLDRVVTEGAWWVRHRAVEYLRGDDAEGTPDE